MKKITCFSIVLAFFIAVQAGTNIKVRVTVNNANIRSEPGLAGNILLKAAKGDEFEVLTKTGSWFKILLPEETGDAREGFISDSVVETVSAPGTAAAAKEADEAERTVARAPRPARTPRAAKPAVVQAEKLFSGLSAKFGLRTTPAGSLGDRWLLALALDKGINPFLALGLEVQPYYRHFKDTELSASTLGTQLFANVKGGVNIGRFVPSLKLLTPYLGCGLGGAFAFSSSTAGEEKASRANFYFAWHLMFGLEVALKNMSVILELQSIKISVPETTPDLTQYFWMIGIRF
jgi:opacity protein-like surface antigen